MRRKLNQYETLAVIQYNANTGHPVSLTLDRIKELIEDLYEGKDQV